MDRTGNDQDLDIDLDLFTRIAALEARAPGADRSPALPSRRRHGRFAVSMAMAPVLALAIVATTATGAVVVSNLVKGYPGIQNEGQPLAGAHMECMTPPEAAALLAAHGFTDVDWQVESGAALPDDSGKSTNRTVHQSTPPAHGYVVPGSLLDDGSVIMVVDQRVDATGTGHCFGDPMP